MAAGRGHEWRRAEQESFEDHGGGIRLADATAGLIATTGPLVVGFAIDDPGAGLIAGLGGLNVALAMGPGRPRERAPWGVATMLAGAAVAALATWLHPAAVPSVLAAMVVVGLASLLRGLGPRGTLAGFVVSAVYVISNGLPGVPADAGPRAGQFLLGGALAVLVMMLAGAVDDSGPPSPPAPSTRLRDLPRVLRDAPTIRRHAAVVALTVAATTVLYRALGLGFGYWIPLTALAVLQPDPHSSRVRLIQRASGTAAGCLVVLAAVAVDPSDQLIVLGVAVASFALFALRERNYHWLVILLTPTALLMISTVDYEGDEIVIERGVNTAIGLAVALLVLSAVDRFAANDPAERGSS